MAGVGFFFWIVAARMYSAEAIGFAGSLISLSALLASIASLGLPLTLIRFLPSSTKPNEKISTSLILAVCSSIVVSAMFWVVSSWWMPEIHALISHPTLWLIFTGAIVITAWQQLSDAIFISIKQTQWMMLQSLIYSLAKLCVLALLVVWAGFGIFMSNFLGMGMAVVVSFAVHAVWYRVNLLAGLNTDILKQIWRYSLGTYVAGLIGIFPTQVLPALVTGYLGAESAAHFFLALMIVNLLVIIPVASSQSLFAAASADPKSLRALTLKSMKLQLGFIALGIVGVWVLGGIVLAAFGKGYAAETTNVLRILSLSVLPMAISSPLTTRLRVRKQTSTLSMVTLIGSLAVVGLSVAGARYGLLGVAIGYVLGQVITMVAFVGEWKVNTRSV